MSIDREENIIKLIKEAISEDVGTGDITSLAIIPMEQETDFIISNRENLVLCGGELIQMFLAEADKNISVELLFNDGAFIKAGSVIARGKGKAQAILAIERVMLNLLQHLCGVATSTKNFVDLVKHTKAKIRDTRKTIPRLRWLQKYAVRTGGGENHRFSLDEMILIKDNHISLCSGSVIDAYAKARASHHRKIIEIECDTLDQVKDALLTGCDAILLDNMTINELKQAVDLVKGKVKLEASGGIGLHNVKAIAETGVDYIAIGSLTHSFKASDIGLDIYSKFFKQPSSNLS